MPLLAEREPPGPSRLVPRGVWLALGWLLVALGSIGALVPLMPTTIFLILAAGCFARSSPRVEARLLAHPRFGPALRAWREEGAIGLRAKVMACLGIVIGYALLWWRAQAGLTVDLAVGIVMAGCAMFIATRPRPRRVPSSIVP